MNHPTEFAPGTTRTVVDRHGWPSFLYADLLGFAVLAAISLLLGLIINQMRHQPLRLVYHSPPQRLQAAVARLNAGVTVSPPASQPHVIVLDDFQAFVATRHGTVIDARQASFYALGHVPGAINLSRANFDADYARLRGQLEFRKTAAIAVYCSGADCPDSEQVANALRELGFTRLLIYREGWEEWSQSGLPQEK